MLPLNWFLSDEAKNWKCEKVKQIDDQQTRMVKLAQNIELCPVLIYDYSSKLFMRSYLQMLLAQIAKKDWTLMVT